MRLIKTTTSQAIRFFESGQPGEPKSPVPLIRAMQDKYGFVQVPHTIADMNLQTGVNFFRGFFRGKMIDKLSVYNNGILCESQQETEYNDGFLDEILSLVTSIAGLELKQTGVRAYVSGLEVGMPDDIGAKFEKFIGAGQKITSLLKSYGQTVDDYRFSGFKMHYDQTGKAPPHAPEFIFERRAGELYSSNIYFSSAPIETKNHFELLNSIEELLS